MDLRKLVHVIVLLELRAQGTISEQVLVSAKNISMENLTYSAPDIITFDFISRNGWDSVFNSIPLNERLWIGARAEFTPYVSWEGCVQYRKEMHGSCIPTRYAGGSIANCLARCRSAPYFVLQKTSCICVTEYDKTNCIRHETGPCNDPCLGNPSDLCGGPDDMMFLYGKGKFENISETSVHDKESCVLFRKYDLDFRLESVNCESNIRRYIYKIPGEKPIFTEDLQNFVTWQEALNLTSRRAQSLYYQLPEIKDRAYYWTSLRRSLNMTWATLTDNQNRSCVTIKRTKTSFILQKEGCDMEYRYIYIGDHQSSPTSAVKWSETHLVITIVSCAFAFFVFAVTVSLYHRRRAICAEPVTPHWYLNANEQQQNEEPHYNYIEDREIRGVEIQSEYNPHYVQQGPHSRECYETPTQKPLGNQEDYNVLEL